jgi:class 3 adenylate cyclase
VHAAARYCYAAHGGQILVSTAARTAIGGELPEGLALRSVGTWRFAGFREPEELYQVVAPGLPRRFPPLRAGERVEGEPPRHPFG